MNERRSKGIIMECCKCGKVFAVREAQSYGRNCPSCEGAWLPKGRCIMLMPKKTKQSKRNKDDSVHKMP
jgi:Zn-finger nucleic acid-binding protein